MSPDRVLARGQDGFKKMAAPGESLKAFVARRKAEYSLRFPFLKERQILVKLRRVWESQKRNAQSTSCKSIQRANVVTSKVPNATNSRKCTQECKENLSTYDISADSVVPLGVPAMRKYTKGQSRAVRYSANTPPPFEPQWTPNCLNTLPDTKTSLATCTSELLQLTKPLDKESPHTLRPLENILTPNNSQDPQSSALVCGSHRNSPQKYPLEESITTSWKRSHAGQQSITNTIPFPSRSACCLEEGSPGDRKTQCPTLANQLRDSGPEQCRKQVMWETPTTSPSPPSPPTRHSKKCDKDSGLQNSIPDYSLADVRATPRVNDSASLDQEFELGDGSEVLSLSLSPVIHSLPSLHSATPNVDTFPRHSEKARSTTLGILADAIRAFDTISRASIEVPVLSAGSKFPESSSDVPPVPSGPLSDNLMHPFHNSGPTSRSELQTLTQKHKSRRNPKSLREHNKKVTGTSERMRKRRYALDLEEASHPAKRKELSDENYLLDSKCDHIHVHAPPPYSSVSDNDLDLKTRTNRPSHNRAGELSHATVQRVPEDSIALSWNGSPPYHPAPSSVKHDLMCDMFQTLTPDRDQSDCHQEARSHAATSKRRIFRSASKEGDSNFSSMFINDSDIFM